MILLVTVYMSPPYETSVGEPLGRFRQGRMKKSKMVEICEKYTIYSTKINMCVDCTDAVQFCFKEQFHSVSSFVVTPLQNCLPICESFVVNQIITVTNTAQSLSGVHMDFVAVTSIELPF